MDPFYGTDETGIPFIQVENYKLKLELEELDEKYLERAAKELRECEENVKEGTEKLLQLLAEETNLVLPLEEEGYLTKFLRPCKYYPESTFRLIKRYYNFIARNPKYAANLLPSEVHDIFCNNIIEFLPLRMNGSRVMIIDIANWDVDKVPVAMLCKAIIMSIEIAMIEPRTQVGGCHVILDVKGLTLRHVMQFTPSLAKMILDFIQECTAIRLKAIHIVNQPYIFNMAYAIFRPFIGQKLKQRLHFHGKNWNEMKKIIPKELLPARFGGELKIPRVPGELLVKLLKYYEDQFERLSHYGYVHENQKDEQ